MDVKIKRLSDKAITPKKQKIGDVGFDLTCISYEYKDNRHVYDTGLSFEIPKGYFGMIAPRSSICKYDLRLTNCLGIIDENYRGSVKAVFENDGIQGRNFIKENTKHPLYPNGEIMYKANTYIPKLYEVGDRICQLIILPYPQIEFIEVSKLSNTERGQAGWGSSGS